MNFNKKTQYLIVSSLLLMTACTPPANNANEANILLAEPGRGEKSLMSNQWSITGSSVTKRVLVNSNPEQKSSAIQQDVDLKAYKSGMQKLGEQIDSLSSQEALDTYTLKTSEIGLNTLLDSVSLVSLKTANIIVEPLKDVNSLIMDSAITSIKDDYQAKIGSLISALAINAGKEISQTLANYQGTPHETQKLREQINALATKELSADKAEKFKSILDGELVTQSLIYASFDIKQVLAGNSATQRSVEKALTKLEKIDEEIVQIEAALHKYIKANNSYLNAQGKILKDITNKNIAFDEKLSFLSQMMFSQLPAKLQLGYLKNNEFTLPLSSSERNEFIKSLEFRAQSEEALQVIADIGQINANLQLFGANEEKAIQVTGATVQAALAFSSGTPVGYVSGVAAISTLFKKNGPDSVTHILKNQQIIIKEIRSLRAEFSEFRSEMNKNFETLRNHIYVSRNIDSMNAHYNNIGDCSIVKNQIPEPQKFNVEELKSLVQDSGLEPHIQSCLNSLRKFYANTQASDGGSSILYQITYDAHMNLQTEKIRGNYDPTIQLLRQEDWKGDYSRNEFSGSLLLDPDVIEIYVSALLNNLYWMEITRGDAQKNLVFITPNKAQDNKSALRASFQALNLVKLAKRQHRIWAGIDGGSLIYQSYVKGKSSDNSSLQCDLNDTNVLCLAINNPVFAKNLLLTILKKDLGVDAYFALNMLTPNNPDYYNQKLNSSFEFIWFGTGADPSYAGEVVTDPKLIQRYGEGLRVQLKVGHQKLYLPAPTFENMKSSLAIEMPGMDKLQRLEAYLVGEISEMNMDKILQTEELKALNNNRN